jgi:DNA-binding SARP family transcriptional activator
MRIRVLGEAVIELPTGDITPSTAHLFALILRLASARGRFLQRSDLARLLYPNAASDAGALHSLRQLVYQARTRGVPITRLKGAVALRDSMRTDIDELELTDHLQLGVRQRNLIVLGGYTSGVSAEYDEWVDEFRTEGHTRLRYYLTTAIIALRKRGEWPAVEARARECLSLDPLNEPATLALAEALARTGSKERALTLLSAYEKEVGRIDESIAVPAAVLRKRIEGSTFARPEGARIPMVGRSHEFGVLSDQWAHCQHGGVRCVVVRGEPGAGKTRLLEEFAEATKLSGPVTLVVVRRSATALERPYGLLAEIVPNLLQRPGAAGCNPSLLPFLHRLIDTRGELLDPLQTPEHAHLLRSGIARAWADLVDATASERPCLICIDDSRAVDTASLSLLAPFVQSQATAKLCFVIACHSPDSRAEFATLAHDTVSLAPLAPLDARTFLESVFSSAGRSPVEDDIAWCLGIAGGNPSYLSLAAAHVIAGMDRTKAPGDIVSAIDQRLGQLCDAARRTLEACVILGDQCDVLMLATITGMETLQLANALNELDHAGLISFGNDRLQIRSTLLRDRVLALASTIVISLLHVRCAQALSSHRGQYDSPWLLATHWLAAGNTKQAHEALAESWRRNLQIGQPELAEQSIRKFLANTQSPLDRVRLFEDLITVTLACGNYRQAVQAIDERSLLVQMLGLSDSRRQSMAADRLDAKLLDWCDPVAAESELRHFMRSEELDQPRRIRAAFRLLVAADATADTDTAEEVFSALKGLVPGDSIAQVYWDQALLVYHSVFGSREEALRLARRLIDGASRIPESWPHVRGMLNASIALQIGGDSEEAIFHLEVAYRQLATAGVSSIALLVAARLASFWLDDGDLNKSARWSRMADQHRRAEGAENLPSDYLSAKADLALLSGDLASARTYVGMMRHTAPMYEAPRFRMEAVSYALRLSQFEGIPCADDDLRELIEWHYRARSFGRHDDIMDVLWVALTANGEQARATVLLRDYLHTHRREVRACRYMLRLRTAEDPIWGESVQGSSANMGGQPIDTSE